MHPLGPVFPADLDLAFCRVLNRGEPPGENGRDGRIAVSFFQPQHMPTVRRITGSCRELRHLPAIRHASFAGWPIALADGTKGLCERSRQMYLIEQEERVIGKQPRMYRTHSLANAISAEEQT